MLRRHLPALTPAQLAALASLEAFVWTIYACIDASPTALHRRQRLNPGRVVFFAIAIAALVYAVVLTMTRSMLASTA